ncbi:MAG: mechanosensitive ion channel family protein [Bacteroidales bacterium]|nr:mechanosensitive ion channel family protein [Bacteroidales bacterium]
MSKILLDICKRFSDYLIEVFTGWGMSLDWAIYFKGAINLMIIALICFISYYITKFIIEKVVHSIVTKTSNKYDDELVKHKVLVPLSHMVPAAIIFYLIKFAITDEIWVINIRTLCYCYNIFSIMLTLMKALNATNDIIDAIMRQKRRKISFKGYIQVAKIVIGIICGLLIISIIIGKNPLALLGGLAGMSAVLMLIFKDSISGFVASIQLSTLNMIKKDDWITIASRNVDGNVIDITLNTVKVKNFDNSVSTIPTASLMSESFINWSNMQEMQARRMKRTILIDANSVKIADDNLLNKLKNISILKDYINQRQQDTENKELTKIDFDKRPISNIELFRKYIEFYIISNYQVFKKYKPSIIKLSDGLHEEYIIKDKKDFIEINGPESEVFLSEDELGNTYINDFSKFLKTYKNNIERDKKDLKTYYPITKSQGFDFVNNELSSHTVINRILEKDGTFVENGHLMVRQMQQTSTGIPLEIYAFTKITEWAAFEKIQTSFFEHLFTMISEFELKVYQLSPLERESIEILNK